MKNKIFSSAIIAMPASIYLQFFNKYIFSDWDFLKYLVVLMVLDTFLGFIKHWIVKDVSSKAYGMIAKKIMVYCAVMILANVIQGFTVNGEQQATLEWFSTFCCTMLMVREGLSIVENVEAIMPGTFPTKIIKRLKDFDSNTGDKL